MTKAPHPKLSSAQRRREALARLARRTDADRLAEASAAAHAATAAAGAAAPAFAASAETAEAQDARPSFAVRILREVREAPFAAAAFVVLAVLLGSAAFGPMLSPFDPYDPTTYDIVDANFPPSWIDGGDPAHMLGTDDQGRDLLALILSGMRLSFLIGFAAAILSMVLGVGAGLVAGYRGGWADALLMRLCDVALTFPALLAALLFDGVMRAVVGEGAGTTTTYVVLLAAMTLTGWVPYARTVRALAKQKRGEDYVSAARMMGEGAATVMLRHVLPNVMGPVWVLLAMNVGGAVMTEATLSFLGVGVPPTTPSLGTLIRIGSDYVLSGEWWIAFFPGSVLALSVLSVNILGDRLRDALNPMLRR